MALAADQSTEAVEPWADANLPVAAGLQFWLDAARPGPAGATAGPLARWDDASGQGRNLLQPTAAFQPTWFGGEGDSASPRVRFDGQDDHLSITGLGLRWEDFTVVSVFAPRSNPGVFRGLLSANAHDQNDYQSGLNIDLNFPATADFSAVNVEGPGFGGAVDLLYAEAPLRGFHRLAVRGEKGEYGSVQLLFDGAAHGSRTRGSRRVNIDNLRIGCRIFRNEPGPPYPVAFLDCEIAELLIYDRALTDSELNELDNYLRTKHAGLLAADAAATPPLHVVAPGMEVRELPVALPNINDLLYLPDGRLLALGYDGRIHLLSDSDGDGLEDKVEPYWYETQFRSPTAMLLAPEGLYVTASGRVSLLVDEDSSGKPDREKVLATDWEPGDIATGGGVDAMGLARDAEGNIYFGLGCADYTNAYRVRDGKSNYKLASERGTILKLLPDGRREAICTGIRFPYSLAFNRAGDLFCTDQEGETWLPGGNPLDELNYIVRDRHYGFPPRHAEYLPDVADEPPAVAFGPQHQSTCGLCFNEPPAGQPAFGPADWEGDAFVAGYSRGKLWRCRLAKTEHGYIGRPTVLAACEMLLLDVQLTPRGDLLVACHSGLPDWGTGPQGAGRLFQIRYIDREAAQPVIAWPVSTMQARVALDRPTSDVGALAGEIHYGATARAGDRFETLKPPYAVVAEQEAQPRGTLRVAEVTLDADRRTLTATTDPQAHRASYELLVDVRERGDKPTRPVADVDFNYSGVVAKWQPIDGAKAGAWNGWLPSPDLAVARVLTRSSAEHGELWSSLKSPGRLTLEGRLTAALDGATLYVQSTGELKVDATDESGKTLPTQVDKRGGTTTVAVNGARSLRIELPPVTDSTKLSVYYMRDGDPAAHPLPLDWCEVPWAPQAPMPAPPPKVEAVDLAGGDWKRGREIFFGQEARCSACHRFEGQGGEIGADLSNLRQRDAASVLRDIRLPSAAINPDYVQFAVVLSDGRSLSGVVRAASGDSIRVFDAEARETVVRRDEIVELAPQPLSLMPQGIDEKLGADKLRDLVTFLTTAEPKPQLPAGIEPPKPRSEAEIASVMPAAVATPSDAKPAAPRPLNIVLVASPQDHGPGEHDYPRWQKTWRRELTKAAGVRVSEAFNWPEPIHWELADVIVMYFWNHDWSAVRLAQLDAFLARGGGVVVIHAATIADTEPEKLAARLGLAAHFGPAKYRHGALELTIAAPAGEPLTRGLKRTAFYDETYWPLIGDRSQVRVLATADEEGQSSPMIWTYQPKAAEGRVFASILGHYSWTFDDPLFRALLLRGIAWTAGEPVDRFSELYVVPRD